MCGISGMIGLTVSEETVQKMLCTMRRRGPDDASCFRNEDAVLLHARLAVIDLRGGIQPMKLTWKGETYILVYNGELYNTPELRRELEYQGHTFLGHSDTEVVLHAYAQYGSDCVNRFNGIFAFAVWEKREKRLFLARDRIGVKPVFYKQLGKGFIFASEIKTILTYPDVKPELDREGAAQLILLGPGRVPGSGVFKDVRELEPGYCGYFQDGQFRMERYWYLRDREHRDSFEDTAAYVRWLVTDAIRRQMVSDVPIGTFLSGGLDSSIITAVCAGEMQGKGKILNTFSVDYEKNDLYFQRGKFQPESDAAYIQLMAESLSTCHHSTLLTAEQLVTALKDAVIARDLPGMADVDASMLIFCGDIRKSVTVALSGECADEIFGGYPWYRDPEVRKQSGFPWAQNTARRASLLCPGMMDAPEDYIQDLCDQTCRQSDILPNASAEERRMKEMVNLNFRWFMQTLLDRKDRMSMYHSLEVRVPFCDHRIAEYLYGVPWEYKDHQGREKGLLRKAMEGIVPEKILYRKKSPYPKTWDPRYTKQVTDGLRLLLEEDAAIWHMINRNMVREILNREEKWPWYGQLMGIPQTAAYFLQIDQWLKHYNIQFCF